MVWAVGVEEAAVLVPGVRSRPLVVCFPCVLVVVVVMVTALAVALWVMVLARAVVVVLVMAALEVAPLYRVLLWMRSWAVTTAR